MSNLKKGVSSALKTNDQSQATGAQSGDTRDPNNTKRPPRISMQQGKNLEVPNVILDRENFHYHWFTERPHRPGTIDRAKGAYYEHVADLDGKQVSRPSGSGITHLMRIPLEYHREDLALKKEKVERTLDQEAGLSANEYAPTKTRAEGGESAIVERTTSESPYA